MQTEIALSTTEAEYIAFSQSIQDLIRIRNMVAFLSNFLKINNKDINTYSTVFEDNSGALQLATEPRYYSRTKHICVKYHHFR